MVAPKVKSTAVYDALIHLLDTINSEPDPLLRLALFSYLSDLHVTRVLPERNRAAYEARDRYAMRNITEVTGSQPEQVYAWAGDHRARTGAPIIKRRPAQDVSDAVLIAGQFLTRKVPNLPDPGDAAE